MLWQPVKYSIYERTVQSDFIALLFITGSKILIKRLIINILLYRNKKIVEIFLAFSFTLILTVTLFLKVPAISRLSSPVALQLRAPPKVSARAPAHRSYHFRGVKLKSCIKKIHHNLYISKQANVKIKHADTEGASHKKFGTDARVQ